MKFCIVEYINSLPEDTIEINCSNRKLKYIPDLSRFTKLKLFACDRNLLTFLPKLPPNLKMLFCGRNNLCKLPALPDSLEYLFCGRNQLSELPELPNRLTNLWCGFNNITALPNLPSTLKELICEKNPLTTLPILPPTLILLWCYDNQLYVLPEIPPTLPSIGLDCRNNPFLYYKTNNFTHINTVNRILTNWKFLFYSLALKEKFRKWLWERVREPKIRLMYHPSRICYLMELEK